MFDTSAENLRRELDTSLVCRNSWLLDGAKELISHYRGEPAAGEGGLMLSYENLVREYVDNLRPQISYSNPIVACDIGGAASQQSEAMQTGFNVLLPAINFGRTCRRGALDGMFSFTAFEISVEKIPGAGDQDIPAMWPTARRISPWFVCVDWAAQHHSEARYICKLWIRDADYLKSIGYDPVAVDAAKGGNAANDARAQMLCDSVNWSQVQRDDVVGWDIYVPETGMIYTIPWKSSGGETGYLCTPRMYYGDPAGPIVIGGIGEDTDRPYPFPALQAQKVMLRELMAHTSKAATDAADAKTLHLIDSASEDLQKVVKNGVHGNVYAIPNLQNVLKSIELSGVSPQTMGFIQFLMARADRHLHLSGATKGQAASGVTATSDAIAAGANQIAVRDAQSMFRETVVEVMRRMARLMWFSPMVKFPVGTPSQAGQPMMFKGGINHPREAEAFPMLGINIQPYSMEAVDQLVVQKRETEKLTLAAKLLPPPVQSPQLWEAVLNDWGQAFNQTGVGTRYMKLMMADAISTIQGGNPVAALAMAAAGGEPGELPSGSAASAGPAQGTQGPMAGNMGGAAAAVA